MANYQLGIIPTDSLNFIQNEPNWTQNSWANNNGTVWNDAPGQWIYNPQTGQTSLIRETITLSAPRTGLTTVDIEDTNTAFGDDPTITWWSPDKGLYADQVLKSPLTIGGVTYPAGTMVENEYEVDLLGSDGATYRMAGVSLSAKVNPGDPYSNFGPTTVVGFTFDGAWPDPGVTLTYVHNSAQDIQQLAHADMSVCFAAGVMIRTPGGEVAVEDLAAGDLVVTKDNGPQPVRWIGSKTLSAAVLDAKPQLRPVRIGAGALGGGVPAADLVVSPQHRVLVRSRIALKMFGALEVLVAAKQLLQLDGVDIAEDLAAVEYFHILFDRHEVVVSNGAETESLYTGPEALRSVGNAAREEILAIFPELRNRDYTPPAARPLPSGRQARKLAIRHQQNGRPLVAG